MTPNATGKKPPPPPPRPSNSKPQKKKFCAKYSFHDVNDDNLDLLTDEEVVEVEPDDEGWTKVQKSDGTQGLVPTNYLSG